MNRFKYHGEGKNSNDPMRNRTHTLHTSNRDSCTFCSFDLSTEKDENISP